MLLIEDNEDDVILTLRAFKKEESFTGRIYTAEDGEEALDFIYHKNKYQDVKVYPRPDLILLDINLPKINGLEFLSKIKSDPRYQCIPCILLTSSDNDNDVLVGYEHNVAGYLVKPVSFSKFMIIVKKFCDYWANVKFPKISE
ncbi:MAG: response regulator [bacterium]|nr:response regulator [bacterium]